MSLQDYPPLPSENDTDEEAQRFAEWYDTMLAKIDMLTTQYKSAGIDAEKATLLANHATWPQEYWSVFCPKSISHRIQEKRKLQDTRIRLIVRQLSQEGKLTVEEIEARLALIPPSSLG